MPAKIAVHRVVMAVVIALELPDQHVQQGHVGAVGPRHASKRAVDETG
jgi:hypothetical protein